MITNSEILQSSNAAKELRVRLAEQGLPPVFAKLYSQHSRLSNDRPGLSSWQEDEIWHRLHDAMRLITAATLEKEHGSQDWRNSLRRAGELLEWLSHTELNPKNLPLQLIASAVYQLAGYPARSTGLLNQSILDNNFSQILYFFLKADFRNLTQILTGYWAEQPTRRLYNDLPWHDEILLNSAIQDWIISETASAIGIICSYMRWGDDRRTQVAVRKLHAIADVFLNSQDPYSWLLAKLCAEVAEVYIETSMRSRLFAFLQSPITIKQQALESYLRYGYLMSKTLAWKSQEKGIERLVTSNSFALCTPTGSGKTTVAEVAILDSVFNQPVDTSLWDEFLQPKPIVLYLVPTRSLATEIESKFNKVLGNLPNEAVKVTGLYGGTDWGPTDAWLTSDDRIVLICTYEKTEALLRFLGPLFLNRVSLIIIDEAHNVQFDGNVVNLIKGESRSLRLEVLTTRLLSYLQAPNRRIIALSAVAAGTVSSLSDWVTGQQQSTPVLAGYRSTRQLIGRLECYDSGRTEIQYDLLDGASLRFKEQGKMNVSDVPYIPNPFPQCSIPNRWKNEGPEKRVRPHLFWAAIHLAQLDDNKLARGVLISVMQQPGGFADDFLLFLNQEWSGLKLPQFFEPPQGRRKLELWQQALASCEDYFTRDSREYELLERGIVLHHGKMPGLMARMLIQLIDERIINIVLATSTLSEGVNLPFETVLIPSLRRGESLVNVSEFRNLVGRAGRPGFGTEGRTLVLLPELRRGDPQRDKIERSRSRYDEIVNGLQNTANSNSENTAKSPLAALLAHIRQLWEKITGVNTDVDFLGWLEKTAPVIELDNNNETRTDEESNLLLSLDSLDAILLSTIVELEQIANEEIDLNSLEQKLQETWQRTFAYFAHAQQSSLESIFVQRGLTLKKEIFPDRTIRRRLYRTGLPPASGNQIINTYFDLIPHLKTGVNYAQWSNMERIQYISEIVQRVANVSQFNLDAKVGRQTIDWRKILAWWLDQTSAPDKPNRKQVSEWHKYVTRGFQYRFNWGLGCIVALALDEAFQGQLQSSSLADWPQTQLPWIVFWLKELIVWGTLDPVATYLLNRKLAITRQLAEERAKDYYNIYAVQEPSTPVDDILNASNIKAWVGSLLSSKSDQLSERWAYRAEAKLLRDFGQTKQNSWRVLPVENKDTLSWVDSAGFILAESTKPDNWKPTFLHEYDFFLNSQDRIITSQRYL